MSEQREANEAAPVDPMPASSVTRVRTLMLCDLVDSTALVERLGDAAAADLIRRHDRLARELLQHHHGREIDKTDGFLALFERPMEAVAFALAYQRRLKQLGSEAGHALAARVGLHVGEVVVWENSASEIADGAKRLDVEGLAKPVAARLMNLALPGQILLSGIAFSLAQRAAPELENAASLRWLTHGRYRFKGVAAPMLVHEVGESGFAPLQAPPSTSKAQRDLPLWRRPGVIALEAVALLVAVAVPIALSLRAAPAIAFGERDWIVVGELRNLTGETLLDDSLETAFRISLEQSRYVNVLSDLKLRDTLARMQKPADTAIDRSVASEIALREGARAVILPTVAEIGGRVRVSAEVVDPHTQTTVYAESADGVGAASTLDSIDSVTHTLREKLGEALVSIEKDSAPLPQVTTKDLDALRAYALGVRSQADGKGADALALYNRAVTLDPDFALARLAMARVHVAANDWTSAMPHIRSVEASKGRLTSRDRMYADAWLGSLGPVEPMLEKWKLLSTMYPDYFAGHFNFSQFSWEAANRFEEAIEPAKAATAEQNPFRAWAFYMLGALYAGLERFDESASSFAKAEALGLNEVVLLRAGALLAQRRFADAQELMERSQGYGVATADIEAKFFAITYPLDQGRLQAAKEIAANSARDAHGVSSTFERAFQFAEVSAGIFDGPDSDRLSRLSRFIQQEENAMSSEAPPSRAHAAFATAAGGYLAARLGMLDAADRVAQTVGPPIQNLGHPMAECMLGILRGSLLGAKGQHDEAIALLKGLVDGNELYQVHVALMDNYLAAGRNEEALAQAQWLLAHRGRAYQEFSSHRILQPLNVLDSNVAWLSAAEASHRLGDAHGATQAMSKLKEAWSPPYPKLIDERIQSLDATLTLPIDEVGD